MKLASAANLEYIPYIEYINLHRLILFFGSALRFRGTIANTQGPSKVGPRWWWHICKDVCAMRSRFYIYCGMTIYTHICSYDFRHILCKHLQTIHKQELNIQRFWCLVVTSCHQIPTNLETSYLKLWNKIVNLTDPASGGTSVCFLQVFQLELSAMLVSLKHAMLVSFKHAPA